MDWKTVGQKIRTRRTALRRENGRKLRQEDLASRVGLTHQFISALEKGDSGASLESLEAIAAALGGELVVDLRFEGEGPADPVADQIRAAIPRLPPKALRALLAQVEAFDALLDVADEE
jgi:transcriptional regulator with XRE-family HTH domain